MIDASFTPDASEFSGGYAVIRELADLPDLAVEKITETLRGDRPILVGDWKARIPQVGDCGCLLMDGLAVTNPDEYHEHGNQALAWLYGVGILGDSVSQVPGFDIWSAYDSFATNNDFEDHDTYNGHSVINAEGRKVLLSWFEQELARRTAS